MTFSAYAVTSALMLTAAIIFIWINSMQEITADHEKTTSDSPAHN